MSARFVTAPHLVVDAEDAPWDLDVEEDIAAQRLVKLELRTARRSATVAFVASLLIFCVVACLAVHVFLFDTGTGLDATSLAGTSSATGLANFGDLSKALEGRLRASEAATALYPVTHRTIADGVLYLEPSLNSQRIAEVAKGRKVFPIKSKGDWVEVVVPRDGASSTATGWLIAEGHAGSVLKKEPQETARLAKFKAGTATVSQETVTAKWERVRAKNEDLKQRLTVVQGAMKQRYIGQASSVASNVASKAGTVAIDGAKNLINMNGVQQDLHKLSEAVQHEFRSPPKPKELIDEIGKLLH